ncbi:MAG: phosphoribosylglycinamide formyltransferase [Paludibacteraceae bacterium]|nr:phosphoribosylglycinamide formyltransferase [Paludibacteraceae bacterium]
MKAAIFASGSGTNFEALVNAQIPGLEIVLMVCDKPDAKVIGRAKRLGVESLVISPRYYENKAAYESAILAKLSDLKVDFICLAGYMRIVGDTLYNAYAGRILNIHPALLPSFKGAHAIDDAFNFGVKVFGVTVHLIDLTIDGGTIIAQRAFEYHGNDRDEVEARIHEIEHVLYPEAVTQFMKSIQ